ERAGHTPIVLEARHRVGGRVYTMREPFAPGLRGEAGAMRIPTSHHLTMSYVERFGLATMPFTLRDENTYVWFNGKRHRRGDLDAGKVDLGVSVHASGMPIDELMHQALAPILAMLSNGNEGAWEEFVREYDAFSLRGFLASRGWSEDALEVFGVLSQME